MFKGFFPLLAGLVLAAGLSQFPEFSQQYTQRVGGAYFELKTVADGFRADAAASDKSVDQAIAEYRAAGTKFFDDRANSVQAVMTREAFLRHHYAVLVHGNGYAQLVEFLRARDIDMTKATLEIFKPAMPLTFEGLAHAALGFLAGFGLLQFGGVFRRKRRVTTA